MAIHSGLEMCNRCSPTRLWFFNVDKLKAGGTLVRKQVPPPPGFSLSALDRDSSMLLSRVQQENWCYQQGGVGGYAAGLARGTGGDCPHWWVLGKIVEGPRAVLSRGQRSVGPLVMCGWSIGGVLDLKGGAWVGKLIWM